MVRVLPPKLTHALGRVSEHGGRVLRVVYNGLAKPRRVVTVYFDLLPVSRTNVKFVKSVNFMENDGHEENTI
jgi:hypothetical protein